MWKGFMAALGAGLLGMGVAAGALPELEPTLITEELTLDGKLDEAAWNRDGAWQGLGDNTRSRFKVLQSARGLYWGFQIADSEVNGDVRGHEDSRIWGDDCVELFITAEAEFSPDRNVREYAHFIFNAFGSRYEAVNVGGVENPGRNPTWQVATRRTATGFDAELFLPFYAVRLVDGARDWRFNVAQVDKTVGKNLAVFAWSPTQTLGDADRFGRMKNVRVDFKRYALEFSAPRFDLTLGGGVAQGRIRVGLHGASQRNFQITSAAYGRDGALCGVRNRTVTLAENGKLDAVCPVAISRSGSYAVRLLARDGEGVFAETDFVCDANLVPLGVAMVHPGYRNTLFASEKDRTLRFNVTPRLDAAGLAAAQLSVRVIGGDGTVRATAERPAPLKTEENVTIHVADWPCGDYTVELTLRGAAPGMLKVPFRILPAAPGNEVYLNRAGQLLVNGRLFFPRGFMGGGDDLEPHRQARSNVIHFYTLHRLTIPEIRARLDACEAAGLKVLMSPFHQAGVGFWGVRHGQKFVPEFSAAEWARLDNLVAAIGSHPALLGWYIYDEPRGTEWLAELQKLYDHLQKRDPYHIVVGLDNDGAGCVAKKAHADLQLLDIYLNPFKDGVPQRPVEQIVNSVELVATAPEIGSLWYVPQAFDVDSFMKPGEPVTRRAPTFRESRATVWGAIAAGAQGMLPYKIGLPGCRGGGRHSNAGVYASPELEIGFLHGIMPELAALEAVLLAEDVTFAASPQGLRTRGKKLGGKNFLIAMNPTAAALDAQIRWPDAAAGRVKVLSEKRNVSLSGGLLKDRFEAYDVHIYTDAADFADSVDLAELNRKINGMGK